MKKKIHDKMPGEAPSSLRCRFNKRVQKPANDDMPDTLPRWNLRALFPAPDSREIKAEMARIDALCDDFAETFEGTLPWLGGADFAEAIGVYEQIEAARYKITCYVTLMQSDSVANFAKLGDVNKWLQENGGKIAFFEGEIGALKESELLPRLRLPALAAYAPWLSAVRERQAQSGPEETADLSGDFAAASREGLLRFYHESMNGLRADWRGKSMSIDALGSKVASPRLSLQERQEGRAAIAAALKEIGPRIALCYNAIIRDDMIDNDLAGMTRADTSVNQANRVDDAVMDTMFEAIKDSYAQLSHRFYEWKARAHGQEVLPRAQLSMPLPGTEGAARPYSFGAAKKLVMKAFRKFSPVFARLAENVFAAGHIDAAPRKDKEGGAFALPGPGSAPYVMLSFTGAAGDVAATLGHELGHAVHQQLAEKACGFLMSDVPTPVAETASIFAEMLVFDEMIADEKDPAARKKLQAEQVENMLGNGLQQLAYYDFEKRVHAARRQGELDFEQISDIWIDTQREYYGPAVALDDYDRYFWMTVPHLFDTPFYVSSYAFAQQVVSGLYKDYKAAAAEGPQARSDFIENYMNLLKAGQTQSLYEMFAPFGQDPETKEFWEKGLSLTAEYLEELISQGDTAPAARMRRGPSAGKGPRA